MQHNNYYETSDLGLATALVAVGVVLNDIDKSNPRRAVFLFADDGSVSAFADSHWKGTLTLPTQTYFDTIKRVKARLYA